jgi:hypothetical protein
MRSEFDQKLRILEDQAKRQSDESQSLRTGQQEERKAFISALEKLATGGPPVPSQEQKLSLAVQAEVRTVSSGTTTDDVQRVDVGQQANMGRPGSMEAQIDRFTDLLLHGPASDRMPQPLPTWGFRDSLFTGMMQLNQLRGPQRLAERSPAMSSLSGVETPTSSVDTAPRFRGKDRQPIRGRTPLSPLSPLSPGQVYTVPSASPGEMASPGLSSGEVSQHDEPTEREVYFGLRGLTVVESSGEIEGIEGSEISSSVGELPEHDVSEGELPSDGH